MNNNKGYWRASARLFSISAYEPSSPSVCRPWLHLCRSQVWPWRGTWLAVTAIAEQVHHAPGDTKPTKNNNNNNSEKGSNTDIPVKRNNLQRARGQKSFADECFSECFQVFVVRERELWKFRDEWRRNTRGCYISCAFRTWVEWMDQ